MDERRAESETQRRQIHDLLMQAPALIALLSGPDHVYELASEQFLRLIENRDIVGKPVREALPGLQDQGFGGEAYFALLNRVYTSGAPFAGEELPVLVSHSDGSSREHFFTVVIQPTRDASGAVDGILIHGVDVTERKQAQDALRASEGRYRQMFESNHAIKLLIDPSSGVIVDANPAAARFYGYALEQLRAMRITDINVQPAEQVTGEMASALSTERSHFMFPHRLASGEVRDVELYASPLELHGRTLLYSIVHDITDRRRAEQALEHQALHDPLTDLANRVLLHDRVEEALLAAKRDSQPLSLLLMDLDRFKEVNDTLGHQHGDLLLQQLGSRFLPELRESDTIARLGGDEFAVLLPGTGEDEARAISRKLLQALDQPFVLDSYTVHVGASIGIALYPDHGSDGVTLLRQADVAMYLAKWSGSGCAAYDPDADQYSPDRLSLVGDLRRAIGHDLLLHYQPQVSLQTGQVIGVEALLRWDHPERGRILPDDFIPLAEHTGLVHPLTAWVLNEALRQCRLWIDQGILLGVAVNLSTRSLYDSQLGPTIATLLQEWEVEPSRLTVELTETAIMDDTPRAIEVLGHLRETGVRIAIDDFGTGYSSLAHLKRLPIDQIKVDKSFVLAMLTDPSDRSIVRATVHLGHDLGMEVVAEGVEDHEVAALVGHLARA